MGSASGRAAGPAQPGHKPLLAELPQSSFSHGGHLASSSPQNLCCYLLRPPAGP